MFERLLLSCITISTKLYLSLQFKKLSHLKGKGNYDMEITSKIGKISFSAILKDKERTYDTNNKVTSSKIVDLGSFDFNLEGMESTVLMDAEELRNCNEIGLEDAKVFYDKVLVPAGARISGWMDKVVESFESEAVNKRYADDKLAELDIEQKRRELDKAYPPSK
jgi:hypothetical protein